MAIVTNGRLEYEMSAIDVTYPDIGKVTYRGSYPLIVSNQWRPEKPPEEYTDCITFTGESSDFTLKATNKMWDGILEWSTDHNTWTTLAGTEEMQSVGQKLYLRGKNTKFGEFSFDNPEDARGVQWVLSAKADCSGNIQTLLDWENLPTVISTNFCYFEMFKDCENLTSAPELPATTLADGCYYSMFEGCTNLTSAPVLPATTLAMGCYSSMFYRCHSLTSAPELPATTLTDGCYANMFNGCVVLTSAPELPATTLADQCYVNMFTNCSSLRSAPELPAMTLANGCYSNMFRSCNSLTAAPELPATTLADECYLYMFGNCRELKVNTTSGNKIFTCPSYIPNAAIYNMFIETGGTFTGSPIVGNTYYWTE